MKLVEIVDGAFEIRWTWLPFWLATNPKLEQNLEGELKTLVALNGLTDSPDDIQLLHRHVVTRLQALFPSLHGLDAFLDGLQNVNPS